MPPTITLPLGFVKWITLPSSLNMFTSSMPGIWFSPIFFRVFCRPRVKHSSNVNWVPLQPPPGTSVLSARPTCTIQRHGIFFETKSSQRYARAGHRHHTKVRRSLRSVVESFFGQYSTPRGQTSGKVTHLKYCFRSKTATRSPPDQIKWRWQSQLIIISRLVETASKRARALNQCPYLHLLVITSR